MRTREGVGAVDDAIRFLRRARPLPPLAFSDGMSAAAAEHVRGTGRAAPLDTAARIAAIRASA